MTATEEPTEATPLISDEHETQERSFSSGWTTDAIRTASLAAAFLVFFTFADVLKYISSVRLVELGICREHYLNRDPSVIDGHGNIPEHLCKSTEIQQRLAHLRGNLAALESVVGLALTLPYGLIIDRVGERTIAGINVLGYVLSCGWLVLVCFYYSAFPIWTAVLAPLFRIIGGGAPVLSSCIYSIAAKHVPDANRSLCFFVFMAAQLLGEIIAVNGAASLLDHDFVYTPMLLSAPFGILCWISLLLIRPVKSSCLAPAQDSLEHEERVKTSSSIRHSFTILSEILRNKNVLLLVATVPVAKLIIPMTEMLLQYIPRRFDISLSWASRALSIQAVESLILLLALLPFVKEVAQIKYHVSSTKVDLALTQFGFLMMSVGCLIMAFAQKLVVFILGLVVFTFGFSVRPALQSVLTDLVGREQIAVLYTVVAMGDGIGTAAGSLILNRTLAVAIGWDDKLWLGLPFIVGAICYLSGFAGSCIAGYNGLQTNRDVSVLDTSVEEQ